jgi:hypothetical protein
MRRAAAVFVITLAACGGRSGQAADSAAHSEAADSTAHSEAADSTAHSEAAVALTDVDSAVAVLRQYYTAIGERDFARAFALWGSSGPPGDPPLSKFAAGYATTDSVRLSIGAPGRVEGAAGSRYIDLPVTVHAYSRDGAMAEYAGSYTLRRTVVTGAPPSDRRWHLYAAKLVESR